MHCLFSIFLPRVALSCCFWCQVQCTCIAFYWYLHEKFRRYYTCFLLHNMYNDSLSTQPMFRYVDMLGKVAFKTPLINLIWISFPLFQTAPFYPLVTPLYFLLFLCLSYVMFVYACMSFGNVKFNMFVYVYIYMSVHCQRWREIKMINQSIKYPWAVYMSQIPPSIDCPKADLISIL